MNTDLLIAENDPMGAAITDFYHKGRVGKLQVFSSMFEEDEIPVQHLFRSCAQMSAIEKLALQKAEGRILDVGAGSGCYSLILRNMGKQADPLIFLPYQ